MTSPSPFWVTAQSHTYLPKTSIQKSNIMSESGGRSYFDAARTVKIGTWGGYKNAEIRISAARYALVPYALIWIEFREIVVRQLFELTEKKKSSRYKV